MRKLFFTLAFFLMALCANAQNNQYFWYQGNLMMGNPIAQIDSVTFGNEDTDSIMIYLPRTIIKTLEIHDTVKVTVHDTIRINEGKDNSADGYRYVDLGLSVLWAEANVGAKKPEDCGNYFSWGETSQKESYEFYNYAHGNYLYDIWKYCENDGLTTLLPEDDAATVNMGGSWRTPTKSEWDELVANCELTFDTINSYPGVRFTASNGQSIFFRRACDLWTGNSGLYDEWFGLDKGVVYWSANVDMNYPADAYCFTNRNSEETLKVQGTNRHIGAPVRGVINRDAAENSNSDCTPTIIHDTITITIHDTVYIHDCAQPTIEASKTEYFWLEGNQDFLIHWRNFNCNIEYSYDKMTWTTAVPMYGGETPENFMPVPENTKIYLRGINGSNNSFWYDWTGCFHTNTEQILSLSTEEEKYTCRECFGAELSAGGNILSMVFGEEFVERANDTVYSTLSRICSALGMLTDASLLYVNPAAYGTNTGSYNRYGNQWGLFQWDHNLKKGPHIKYLKSRTFYDCESLTDIYYIGDGSEISDTIGDDWGEPEGGERWFNENTSKNVETLTIHVKPGVSIPYKPANAVVVEDLQ